MHRIFCVGVEVCIVFCYLAHVSTKYDKHTRRVTTENIDIKHKLGIFSIIVSKYPAVPCDIIMFDATFF